MALKARSLFLYGIEVTTQNRSIDFKISGGGSELQATLRVGFYSLGTLLTEVVRALQEADPSNSYTATADRTINGGTENRVTIETSGTFLSLLFATGSRAASSAYALLGFPFADQTGSTSYTGDTSVGTPLITNREGYVYVPTEAYQSNFGKVNVSASGQKEAITFSTQFFFQAQFKWIPSEEMESDWSPLMTWMIAQKPFDFTPEITDPDTFVTATLESTPGDGTGLGFRLTEMLPVPDMWDTGIMKFRKVPGT